MENRITLKTVPYQHQKEEFELCPKSRAWLWDPGLGKSKIVIDTVSQHHAWGTVDCLLVVAPPGVTRNWVNKEFPEHCPTEFEGLVYESSKASTKRFQRACLEILKSKSLICVAISFQAFTTKKAQEFISKLFACRKVAFALDESHYIKNPKAKRTKSIMTWAPKAVARYIMTGTPTGNSPLDVYSQMAFVEPRIWKDAGFKTYVEFEKQFCVYGTVWNPNARSAFINGRYQACNGAQVQTVVDYKNLDDLHKIISPHCSSKRKNEVLDLPDKIYTIRSFDLDKTQEKAYQQLENEFMVWLQDRDNGTLGLECKSCKGTGKIQEEGFTYQCDVCQSDEQKAPDMSAALAIVRMLRMQQITSGYLQLDDGSFVDYCPNPRIEALKDILEETSPQLVIVWARFTRDIDQIMNMLQKENIPAVRYDGQVSSDDREKAKIGFQNGDYRVFIANQSAASTGITLTAATVNVYYSNTFSLTQRLQSEDRAHRIGQKNNVLYFDLQAANTIDETITEALQKKQSILDKVLGQ